MSLTVRHAEPDDAEALHRVFCGPKVVEGTLQLPYQSLEGVRKRWLDLPEGTYAFVACVEQDVVGSLSLSVPRSPRRRHVGQLGMATRGLAGQRRWISLDASSSRSCRQLD